MGREISNKDEYHSKLYLAPRVEVGLGNAQVLLGDGVYLRSHIESIGVPEVISRDKFHVSNTNEMSGEVVIDMVLAGIEELFSDTGANTGVRPLHALRDSYTGTYASA